MSGTTLPSSNWIYFQCQLKKAVVWWLAPWPVLQQTLLRIENTCEILMSRYQEFSPDWVEIIHLWVELTSQILELVEVSEYWRIQLATPVPLMNEKVKIRHLPNCGVMYVFTFKHFNPSCAKLKRGRGQVHVRTWTGKTHASRVSQWTMGTFWHEMKQNMNNPVFFWDNFGFSTVWKNCSISWSINNWPSK